MKVSFPLTVFMLGGKYSTFESLWILLTVAVIEYCVMIKIDVSLLCCVKKTQYSERKPNIQKESNFLDFNLWRPCVCLCICLCVQVRMSSGGPSGPAKPRDSQI